MLSKINLYLITNSSINNSISNMLWISNKRYKINDRFIIINFEKYSKNNFILFKKLYKYKIGNNNILFINLNNIFLKIFYFIYLLILFKSINFFNLFRKRPINLIVVQPRFSWLVERFKILGIIFPKFNTILVGDGLGGECLKDKPFWIQSNLGEYSRLDKENLLSSFYLYQTEKNISPNKFVSRYKYSKKDFLNNLYIVENYLCESSEFTKTYNLINSISNNYRKIFIFPTTTLWEYKRTSLSSELMLYEKFLKLFLNKFNFDHSKDFILIKLHPKTNAKKVDKIIDIFLLNKLKNFSNLKQINILKKFPIELIIYKLLKDKKNSLYISGLSTAIVPVSLILKAKNILLGFGEELLNEHFEDKDNLKKRLLQEQIISDLVDLNKKEN